MSLKWLPLKIGNFPSAYCSDVGLGSIGVGGGGGGGGVGVAVDEAEAVRHT